MINRSWFNCELSNDNYNSNCDLKLNEILNRFYDMSLILTNNNNFKNLEELSIYLSNNKSALNNFNKWFFESGKVTLIKLSEIKLEEDFNYVEDLNYLIFCLDCIFIDFTLHLEDNFITFIDIILHLEDNLLKKV